MVVGLTGKEQIKVTTRQTTCTLCLRIIRRGDEAVFVTSRYKLHPDCALAEFTRETAGLRGDIKQTRVTRRTRNQKKTVHVSTGKVVCYFCHKLIVSGDTYVNQDSHPYHNSGRNSCVVRIRRVVNNMRSSLY